MPEKQQSRNMFRDRFGVVSEAISFVIGRGIEIDPIVEEQKAYQQRLDKDISDLIDRITPTVDI